MVRVAVLVPVKLAAFVKVRDGATESSLVSERDALSAADTLGDEEVSVVSEWDVDCTIDRDLLGGEVLVLVGDGLLTGVAVLDGWVE